MRKLIMDSVSDLVADFLYYDRKEDYQLPLGAIDNAIRSGEISQQEIVDAFDRYLAAGLNSD